MKKLLAGLFGAGIVAVIFGLLLCISPAIFLWVMNSLAAIGGVAFYIPHTIWNYWVALWFIICVRGLK